MMRILVATVLSDERAAAFFALGIGGNSTKASAVLCTSGKWALLNYYPCSFKKAFYSDVPLGGYFCW